MRRLRRRVVVVAGLLVVAVGVALGGPAAAESWFTEPPAPGPHLGLQAADLAAVRGFPAGQPLVGTYLFYWYDVYSGSHLTNGDGSDACTDHPPTWYDYSYLSTRWWRQQLRDLTAAGMDFAAPVYWGYPGDYQGWSFQGLPPLVRALESLERRGEPAPRIALFYDTSTLAANPHGPVDLSTPEGQAWFYCTIRDFFSCLPPRHWAAVDGRPLVLLYSPSFAARQDAALFPYVRKRFRQDFGCEPYLIKQSAWQGEADSVCEWGGALGLQLSGCAALGPGYDHSAVPGRRPLVVRREGGEFYARNWETLLSRKPPRRPWLVMVETWNEFHEGTDVAPSLEYGRQYVDLTRKYADLFHARVQRATVPGPYGSARSVQVDYAQDPPERGIRVPSGGDGVTTVGELAGRRGVSTAPSPYGGRYLYFNLDSSFAYDLDPQPMRIVVEYRDEGCEAFALEYDSADPRGSVRDGAFKPGGQVQIGHTGEWKMAAFTVTDAAFADRCNGADFRLAVLGAGDLAVARVEVSKER